MVYGASHRMVAGQAYFQLAGWQHKPPSNTQECLMRRSHSETQELVAARVTDYVEGNASEVVLQASLKALGLDHGEIKYTVWVANLKKLKETAK